MMVFVEEDVAGVAVGTEIGAGGRSGGGGGISPEDVELGWGFPKMVKGPPSGRSQKYMCSRKVAPGAVGVETRFWGERASGLADTYRAGKTSGPPAPALAARASGRSLRSRTEA